MAGKGGREEGRKSAEAVALTCVCVCVCVRVHVKRIAHFYRINCWKVSARTAGKFEMKSSEKGERAGNQ